MVESSRADRHIFPASARIDRSVFRILQSFTQRIFLRGSSGYTVPVVCTRKSSVFLAERGCRTRRRGHRSDGGMPSPRLSLNKVGPSQLMWAEGER